MNRLVIKQNTVTENVTTNLISKLYTNAKEIKDYEELNDVLDSQVELLGNLQVPNAYDNEVTYLEAKFPNLHINVTVGRYIKFADPQVETILKTNNVGDGVGCTLLDLYNIASLSGDVFGGSSITSFNEFQYFNPAILLLANLFVNCSSLTEITLPVGTTLIRSGWFGNCSNLVTINNTQSITSITGLGGCSSLVSLNTPALTNVENWGCMNCTSLTTIDLSHCTSIGRNAFQGCTSLDNIDLSSCTSLGQEAFIGCTSLTTVTLNPLLTSIGNSVFLNCTSLTSIDLSNVTSINYGAFKGCTSLLSIDLSNVTSLSGNTYENGTFMNCTALTTVTGLENLPAIGKYAFYNCTSLGVGLNLVLNLTSATDDNYTNLDYAFYKTAYSNIELHSTVAYNLACAFRYMPNLKKLDLSDSILGTVLEVGECYWYSSIETIILPDLQLPFMSWRALADSAKLKTYIILSSTPPTITGSTLYWNNIVHFYVPDSAVATYQAASGWSDFASRIYGLSHSDLNGVTWYTKEHPST